MNSDIKRQHKDYHRNEKSRSSHFTSYSKYYLSNVWVKILKFPYATNFVNVLNRGNNLSVKINVPNKDYVSSMILKLPMVCKYTVMQICTLVYVNCCWLAGLIMAAPQRKYVEEPVFEHAEETRSPREEPTPEKDQKQRSTRRHFTYRRQPGRVVKYVQSLRWTPIPIGFGFALLAYQHYRRVIQRNSDPKFVSGVQLAKEWEVTCYRMVPLRAFSRAWGWVHSVNLPIWARAPFYTWYADAFECKIHEAEVQDLQHYKNLGEFFRRGLKAGVRPVCMLSSVVSPVDGTVLQCGKVECGHVEQVKGVSYSLSAFLGPQVWNYNNNNYSREPADIQRYCDSLLKNNDTALFHCVIYLAPGDYHRFHSPVNWRVHFRRHFAGELLSVNPVIAKWISGLFSLNERVAYVGEWEYGFFSYTAVGATNVGSIKVYEDEDLVTNTWYLKKNTYLDKKFEKPITMYKGADFGEFNLGSTVVLLFEAPPDFEINAAVGSKIQLGEGLFKEKEFASRAQSPMTAQANRSL